MRGFIIIFFLSFLTLKTNQIKANQAENPTPTPTPQVPKHIFKPQN